MKKFVLFLASGLWLFSSCSLKTNNETDDPDTRRELVAYLMHTSNINQIIICLDPFNLAFRLNTLMIESEAYGGDVNHTDLTSIRQALFGQTTITSDNTGTYTLTLQGEGEYDYLRSGTVVIQTNGSTLSDGNSWTLSIPKSAKYCISNSSSIVGLYVDGYMISSTEDNKWDIQIQKLVSSMSSSTSDNLEDDEESEAKSNWSGKITITQNKGDQTLASIKESTYNMDVASDHQITTMYTADTMSVQTTKPLTFNPACELGEHIVGNGVMSSAFTNSGANPLDVTLSTWKGEGNECNPEVETKYLGTVN